MLPAGQISVALPDLRSGPLPWVCEGHRAQPHSVHGCIRGEFCSVAYIYRTTYVPTHEFAMPPVYVSQALRPGPSTARAVLLLTDLVIWGSCTRPPRCTDWRLRCCSPQTAGWAEVGAGDGVRGVGGGAGRCQGPETCGEFTARTCVARSIDGSAAIVTAFVSLLRPAARLGQSYGRPCAYMHAAESPSQQLGPRLGPTLAPDATT